MERSKIVILIVAILFVVLTVFAVVGDIGLLDNRRDYKVNVTELSNELTIDNSNWQYDKENNIYYQLSVPYCTNPESLDYESLSIYVPGDYFTAKENDNGTYTCSDVNANVGNYSTTTAPIVMPINTAGYSAQACPTTYNANDVKDFTDAGIIYVSPGCRGRENGDDYSGGAPWGVADLKAAVLYLKFNGETLPGDSEKIFSFGHSGGGAQSAVLGASGDSEKYVPYLESIGAALVDRNGKKLSDSIYGAMCWCPITSLDTADEAYEWTMGQYSSEGTRGNGTWTTELSDDLARSYALYINDLKLKSSDGKTLTLEESDDGIYTSGSYYDYMLRVVEDSLNDFLNDTEFPYTPSSSGGMSMGSAPTSDSSSLPTGDSGSAPTSDSGSLPSGDSGSAPTSDSSSLPTGAPSDNSGSAPSGDAPSDMGSASGGEAPSDMGSDSGGEMPSDASSDASSDSSSNSSSSNTYQTPQDYIDSLNEDEEWVIYDNSTNTAKITSIEAFVNHCKSPSKDVGAFDDLGRGQAENDLFGNDESDSLHFDGIMANILKENGKKYSNYSDYDSSKAKDYANDLSKLDKLNNTMENRLNMYNPMYYLCDYYGSDESHPAKYWRINSGIEQGDTSFTVETNLALALMQCGDVKSVEFNEVWGQGHTQAERTGSANSNFINWIHDCLSEDSGFSFFHF